MQVRLGELSSQIEQLQAKLEDTNYRLAQLSQQIASTNQELIGYFNKDRFIERELSSLLGDSIIETTVLTDSGLIKKSFLNDSLILISKIKEINLIEMKFKKNGKGYYQYYPDYNPDNIWQIHLTCQPIPAIMYKNKKLIIHFKTMAGEYENEFKLKGDYLIILDDDNIEERYIRYKNKNAM
jgi:hypothetical protein